MPRLTAEQLQDLDMFRAWFDQLDSGDRMRVGLALDASNAVENLVVLSDDLVSFIRHHIIIFASNFLIRTVRVESAIEYAQLASYFHQRARNSVVFYTPFSDTMEALRRVGNMSRYQDLSGYLRYFDLQWARKFAADVEAGKGLDWSYTAPLVLEFGNDFVNSSAVGRLHQTLTEDAQNNKLVIWWEWYESILKGQYSFGLRNFDAAKKLEEKILFGGKSGELNIEFWEREPGEINREIAEWVAEARAAEVVVDVVAVPLASDFPPQTLDATIFGLNAEGRIDRIAIPPEQQLSITPLKQRQYEVLRNDAEALLARGQILGKLGDEISDLVTALPADMKHAAVFDVWRAINRLRRTMNAHGRVIDSDEPHEAKLELGIAEELGFLLDTANNFAFDDPGLRRRDEQSIPPQDKQSIADEKALGDALAKAALNEPEMFTPAALDVVKAEERNAETAGGDAHGQQAIDQTNKTRRNLFAVIVSAMKGEGGYAWKEYRGGAYKALGASTVGVFATEMSGVTAFHSTIIKFAAEQGSNVLNYVRAVYNNPTLTAYIEYVLKAPGV